MKTLFTLALTLALTASAQTSTTLVTPPPAPPPSPPNGATVPNGQWVYTTQYGWIWMPWDQQFTTIPAIGSPLMYAYGATLGWSWISAPWVSGYGPTPIWGRYGRNHFVWHVTRPPLYVHRAAPFHSHFGMRGGFRHR